MELQFEEQGILRSAFISTRFAVVNRHPQASAPLTAVCVCFEVCGSRPAWYTISGWILRRKHHIHHENPYIKVTVRAAGTAIVG